MFPTERAKEPKKHERWLSLFSTGSITIQFLDEIKLCTFGGLVGGISCCHLNPLNYRGESVCRNPCIF